MSANFSYIDISAGVLSDSGQFASTATGPMVAIAGLADLRQHFSALREGYMMWADKQQRYYAFFRFNADGQRLQLSIVMSVPVEALIPGRALSNTLSALRVRLSEGEPLSRQLVDRIAAESGMPQQPLMSPEGIPAGEAENEIACRTYTSAAELANIFGFPRQKDYDPFRRIVIVPASVTDGAPTDLPLITTLVDKALMVVCPEGASASSPRVEFSDRLTVVYSCNGFDPVAVMFEVGTTNRYVRINGPALVVNNALHAGIIFHKRIPYSVTTSTGLNIDTYTILINDRTANRTDGAFEVANTDFRNGSAKITVSSTNFSTYKAEFTPEQLAAAAPLSIVLEPESKSILLRLDFGGGRVVEETLNIEKNTPEYCRLRAGNFHGFRAHRLMGSSPETYNVDVRPAAPLPAVEEPQPEPDTRVAVADTPDRSAAAPADRQDQQGPVAPVVEKAPTAIYEEPRHERKAPEFANETATEGKKKMGNPLAGINYAKVGMGVITVVIALLAIWFLASKVFSGTDEQVEAAAADSIAAADPAAPAAIPAPAAVVDTASMGRLTATFLAWKAGIAPAAPESAAPAAITPDEQADIDYLNSSSRYNAADLKTEKYKQLYAALAAADIDALAASDYFRVEGRCTNRRTLRLIEMLWTAKGSNQQKNHVAIMAKEAEKGYIDLTDAIENVARRMPPASETNQAERPQVKP